MVLLYNSYFAKILFLYNSKFGEDLENKFVNNHIK